MKEEENKIVGILYVFLKKIIQNIRRNIEKINLLIT